MYNNENGIDQAMQSWMTTKRFTAETTTNAKIRQRVLENLEHLGGYVSVASFERAYLELLNEDEIQPFRGSISEQPAAPTLIPKEITEFIESPRVSAFEQRRRYANDPQFKKYYDLYADQQLKARIAQETGGVSLTAEEYRALPAAITIQRYRRDKGFKIAVDKLIAQGKI